MNMSTKQKQSYRKLSKKKKGRFECPFFIILILSHVLMSICSPIIYLNILILIFFLIFTFIFGQLNNVSSTE